MMRVLLINPTMNLKLGRFAGLLEPITMYWFGIHCRCPRTHGCLVHVVDMFAEKLSGDQVVQRARDFKPTLVGMTVLTPSGYVCSRLSNMIRAGYQM